MLRKLNKIAQHILAEKGKVHTKTQAMEICPNHNKPWQEIGKEKKILLQNEEFWFHTIVSDLCKYGLNIIYVSFLLMLHPL